MSARVLSVGGAILDVLCLSHDDPIPGTSNPGRITTAAGGVARNFAENLARLGTPVSLISALADDPAGIAVQARCVDAGIDMEHVVAAGHGTGIYSAILTPEGELSVAISDLAATEEITLDQTVTATDRLSAQDIVFVDGNLRPEVAEGILAAAHRAGARTIAEPVSVPKAQRLRAALVAQPPWLVTPNIEELVALTGGPVNYARVGESAARLLDLGVTYVWVRLGRSGSALSWRDEAGEVSSLAFAAPVVPVTNVTGAGDAMTAGFIHALLRGSTPAAAAAYGHIVSALTVASGEVVRSDLSEALVAESGGSL